MEIRIYDKNFSAVGIADVSDGITAVETGDGTGSLELTLPASVPVGGFVTVGGVPYSVTSAVGDGDKTKVRATEALKLLKRKTVTTATRFTGAPWRIIKGIVDTFGDGSISVTGSGGDSTVWVTNYGTVLEEVSSVAETFGLYLTVSIGAGGLVLRASETTDKTATCLSDNLGTAKAVGKRHDISQYVNRAVVYSSSNASTVDATVTVDASSCAFGDGIADSAYGTVELPVYKYANKVAYLYETVDGYTTITRAELMRREGKTALRAHRPIIEYEMRETAMTPPLSIGDRVTVRAYGEQRSATLVKRTTEADGVTLTLRA